MTIAAAVTPAVTMAVAEARTANHGARCSADNCADRPSDHRTRGAADCSAGYCSFSATCRVCGNGQGGDCRKCGDDEKFAHGLLHSFNLKKNAQMLAKFARQDFVQTNES